MRKITVALATVLALIFGTATVAEACRPHRDPAPVALSIGRVRITCQRITVRIYHDRTNYLTAVAVPPGGGHEYGRINDVTANPATLTADIPAGRAGQTVVIIAQTYADSEKELETVVRSYTIPKCHGHNAKG